MRPVRLALLASASIFVAAPALAQAPQVEKNVSMAMLYRGRLRYDGPTEAIAGD